MKALNIVLAVLGGAVAGGAVGLLLAPEKGEDTRKNIMKYLESKGVTLHKTKLEELADEIADELGK
ncbi:MAG: YtxH domain-containing protein [Duncaniella sp.]|nr:YtxH domain-containing protein [Duncaniella sp.]